MYKDSSMTLRVNSAVKNDVEQILDGLGLNISTAVDLYFRQIQMTKSIPFRIAYSPCPPELNMDSMSREQVLELVEKSERDVAEGKYTEVKDAFAEFKKRHGM